MIYLVTIFGTFLLFIMVWAALNKPRQYAGTCDERLHFTWHVIQLAMVALVLLTGAMATGVSWEQACTIFGNWRLQTAFVAGGALYIVAMRVWPKLFKKVPRWL